jgi:hypothetical protein
MVTVHLSPSPSKVYPSILMQPASDSIHKLTGSALYVFGDTVNDHGLFTVTLDNNPPETYVCVSGCGGTFGKFCEKTIPSLLYFASDLGSETHIVTIGNIAGVNDSYFGASSLLP